MRRQLHRTLIVLTALVLGATGCELGTEGEAGELSFVDRTPRPGEILRTDGRLDYAIAAGAILQLGVRRQGAEVTPQEAVVDDPSVLEVLEFRQGAVMLRGGRPGRTGLTVRAGEISDRIVLPVTEIDRTLVYLYPMGEFQAGQAGLDVTEAVLLPGARIWGFVAQEDAQGRRLTGFGATPCELFGGGRYTKSEMSDRFTLDAPDTISEDDPALTLECGKSRVSLPLAQSDVIEQIEVFDFFGRQFGPEFTVDPGSERFFVLVARDDKGRVVQGSMGTRVALIDPPPSTVLVEAVDYTDAPEMDELLARGRGIALRFTGLGTATFDLAWSDHTATVTVHSDYGSE